MASKIENVMWGAPDNRGPMGQVQGGGRKLVRLDRDCQAALRPGGETVQPCRVIRDTAPGNAHKGVLFVIPIGPAVDREVARTMRAAQDLVEVRAEWEAAWRQAVWTPEGLRPLVGGHYPQNIGSDGRWGDYKSSTEPKNPVLRVIGGQAGVWSRNWTDAGFNWGELILPLPELGQGEELAKRLVAAWYSDHDMAGAQVRLADLGLTAEAVDRKVTTSPDGGLVVSWTGMVLGESIKLAYRHFTAPNFETGAEHIPEVASAQATWSKNVLDQNCKEGSDTRIAGGVVTTHASVTETYRYESPDGRGTRIGGGDQFTVVILGGKKVGTVLTRYWPQAQAFFGLVEGGSHPGLSARQLLAFHYAYADRWLSGTLGPRGRAAMLAEAGVNYDPVAVMAAGQADKARRDAEAKSAAELTKAAADQVCAAAEVAERESGEKQRAVAKRAKEARYGTLIRDNLIMGLWDSNRDVPLIQLIELDERGEQLLAELRVAAALPTANLYKTVRAVRNALGAEVGLSPMSDDANWRPASVSDVAKMVGVSRFVAALITELQLLAAPPTTGSGSATAAEKARLRETLGLRRR